MALPGGGDHVLVRLLVRRGLALLYLLAFLVAARQFRPLAGEDGLLPLGAYVDRRSFRERPSLFHRFPDDRVVGAAAWTGVGLSILALAGAPGWLPSPVALPASMALWAALWALYLSFVNAGQTFYGYGWESMLLETGFLAVFLGTAGTGTPVLVVWLLRWVLFRNMFGAGLIKLRGDDCWRDLTCLDHHYETQPIPNPVSWFAHHLPDRFHRVETLGNHVVELAVPFLYFAPQPFAAAAGALTIGFQGWLMLTGNFAWLNALTVVLAVATFSDGVLAAVLPVAAPASAPVPLPLQVAAGLLTLLVVVRSVEPVRNMLSERQAMNAAHDPLHLVNSYGAFGSVTRERYEVVIEGTADGTVTASTEWREYGFPGKPTDPSRRPRQIAPYHLRLDWQLWFAAMSPTPRRSPWFRRLLRRLLAGDEAVRSLLATDPFPDDPPTHVRAVRYRYRYTTPEERAETGRWWHRERVGTYVRPLSRTDPGGSRRRTR
ncbi:MAG: lipase maturation factor family protein [Haloferacaceae archaeon]